MNRDRSMRFNFREGFFANRSHYYLEPLRLCRVEHEKRKLAVAGNEPEFLVPKQAWVGVGSD